MNIFDYLNSKLDYYDEAKNVHQEHIADEVINKGQAGINQAIKIIESIIKKDQASVMVTMKWDGAPAIIFGTLPQDVNGHSRGTFFVGTKGVFNKSPKFATNAKEVRENYASGLAEILIVALNHLPKIAPKGIYQGDLMWAEGTRTSKQKKSGQISFKPNTIKYAVSKDKDPGLYKVIDDAKLGIAVHTQYAKPGETKPLDQLGASFNITLASMKFKDSNDVWVTDAVIRGEEGEDVLSAKEIAELKKIITDVKTIKINPELFDALKQLKPDYIVKTFINSLIKSESVVIGDINSFIDKFKDWHLDRMTKEKAELKKQEAKEKRDELHNKNIALIEDNKNDFLNMLKIYILIEKAKNIIVTAFENYIGKGSMTMWIKEGDKWNPTSAEGFCAVDKVDNSIIKLVNRLAFSRANLLAGKPGED